MEAIRMIGYDAVHPADFIYDVPENHGYYLLILTHTPARFWLDGEAREYPAHHAALFAPQSRIRYGACGDRYGNDWMIFDSDDPAVARFPRIGAPFPVLDPEYCHQLFRLLTWEHAQDGDANVIAPLFGVLLQKLGADLRRDANDGYARELLALRRSIMNAPRQPWSVAAMADRLHISPGYLQLLYKRQFGVSCIDDVIQCRLRLAKEYLLHTQMRISEIAALCGYNSAEHFCRQFRRLCGAAPGQFRRDAAGPRE